MDSLTGLTEININLSHMTWLVNTFYYETNCTQPNTATFSWIFKPGEGSMVDEGLFEQICQENEPNTDEESDFETERNESWI